MKLVTNARVWMAHGLAAIIGHLLAAELGTFPGWDEGVFSSQSGDIVGVDPEPSSYSPSREPGTLLLIAGLRMLGLNLEKSTRDPKARRKLENGSSTVRSHIR